VEVSHWPEKLDYLVRGYYAEDVLLAAKFLSNQKRKASVGVIVPPWGEESHVERAPHFLIWPREWVRDVDAKPFLLQNLGWGESRYPWDCLAEVDQIQARVWGETGQVPAALEAYDRYEICAGLIDQLQKRPQVYLCPEKFVEYPGKKTVVVWGPQQNPVRYRECLEIGRARRTFLAFELKNVPGVFRDVVVWESQRGELYMLERWAREDGSARHRLLVEGWDPRILSKTSEVESELSRIFPGQISAMYLGTIDEGDGRPGFSPGWDFSVGRQSAACAVVSLA
jgi:hypothetical protein